jgi:hypothetical protein
VWKGKDGSAIKTSSPIVHPDDMDPHEQALIEDRYQVCGTCKYFEKAEGQAQMQGQRFVERLVREENWQVKHLASPLNELGICGAHSSGHGGDQMLTGRMHKACDQYRPDRGRLSLRRKSTDDD